MGENANQLFKLVWNLIALSMRVFLKMLTSYTQFIFVHWRSTELVVSDSLLLNSMTCIVKLLNSLITICKLHKIKYQQSFQQL